MCWLASAVSFLLLGTIGNVHGWAAAFIFPAFVGFIVGAGEVREASRRDARLNYLLVGHRARNAVYLSAQDVGEMGWIDPACDGSGPDEMRLRFPGVRWAAPDDHDAVRVTVCGADLR